MSTRTKPVKLFETDDGRLSSSQILHVRDCERAILISQGWDCDDACEKITVYRFLHYPSNAKCEDAIIYKYEKSDCCGDTVVYNITPAAGQDPQDVSVTIPDSGSNEVVLQKSCPQLIIDEPGQYLLHRTCGAAGVCVISKYDKVGSSCCK